ncbi:hypothetical protein BZK37_14825 [Enterococcus casseliflavus]|nr:hypothetical protein BZK37_14825 [Enterococcus casseliflavus]
MSYKEKWITEGYYSAMQQNLELRVVFEHESPDLMIVEFDLRKSDFDRYCDFGSVDFIDVADLPEKVRKIWLS